MEKIPGWLVVVLALVAGAILLLFLFSAGAPGFQLNVEYFFRLIYDCFAGACYGSAGISGSAAWLAHLWLWIIAIGYILAIFALIFIVYCMVRLFELRRREEQYYSTLILAPEEEAGKNMRWQHIESLAGSDAPSAWREAIIEADIMLDDMLARQGYEGEGVAEKLKGVDQADFNTLQDAWEAHRVRNRIAHEGSTFDLSETLARRTIARYESVFREFRVL